MRRIGLVLVSIATACVHSPAPAPEIVLRTDSATRRLIIFADDASWPAVIVGAASTLGWRRYGDPDAGRSEFVKEGLTMTVDIATGADGTKPDTISVSVVGSPSSSAAAARMIETIRTRVERGISRLLTCG